jgi:hypothetical protein
LKRRGQANRVGVGDVARPADQKGWSGCRRQTLLPFFERRFGPLLAVVLREARRQALLPLFGRRGRVRQIA